MVGGSIRAYTYAELINYPAAILLAIAVLSSQENPQNIYSSGNSGTGTTVSITLSDTGSSISPVTPSYFQGRNVYALDLSINVPYNSAMPQPTVAVTASSKDGEPLNQTITAQFQNRTSQADINGNFMFFFGINDNGVYYYAPAYIAPAQAGTPAITAMTVAIACTGLSGNNTVSVSALTSGHLDVNAIQALIAMKLGPCACTPTK